MKILTMLFLVFSLVSTVEAAESDGGAGAGIPNGGPGCHSDTGGAGAGGQYDNDIVGGAGAGGSYNVETTSPPCKAD